MLYHLLRMCVCFVPLLLLLLYLCTWKKIDVYKNCRIQQQPNITVCFHRQLETCSKLTKISFFRQISHSFIYSKQLATHTLMVSFGWCALQSFLPSNIFITCNMIDGVSHLLFQTDKDKKKSSKNTSILVYAFNHA